MKRVFALCTLSCCLTAEPNVKITYLAAQASVQDVIETMAAQAGLKYNGQKSFDQTDQLCRRLVRDVRIVAVPFEDAIQQILKPIGLRYEIEDGAVVLSRPMITIPDELEIHPGQYADSKLINYSVAKKSVQYVVIDLAVQVARTSGGMRISP